MRIKILLHFHRHYPPLTREYAYLSSSLSPIPFLLPLSQDTYRSQPTRVANRNTRDGYFLPYYFSFSRLSYYLNVYNDDSALVALALLPDSLRTLRACIYRTHPRIHTSPRLLHQCATSDDGQEKKKKRRKKKTPCDEKVEWSRRGVRRYVRREYRKVGRTHLSQKKERIRFRGGGAWACAFLHVPSSMHTTAPKHCKYRYCGGLCMYICGPFMYTSGSIHLVGNREESYFENSFSSFVTLFGVFGLAG